MFLYNLTLSPASGVQVSLQHSVLDLQVDRQACSRVPRQSQHLPAPLTDGCTKAVVSSPVLTELFVARHGIPNKQSEARPLNLFLPQMAVYGNFSGHKAQEVMISRGSVLELLRPDEAGHMQVATYTDKPFQAQLECSMACAHPH